jgi:hypothetical protein
MIREANPESRTFFPSRIPNPDPGSRGQKAQKCTGSWIHNTTKTQTKKWTKQDCSYYTNGSFSPMVMSLFRAAPSRLLQDLILFRNVSSSAATTKIDPIHRQWLHCGHYKTWSCSPTVAPLRTLPELILQPGNGAAAGNLDELGHAGASLATLKTAQGQWEYVLGHPHCKEKVVYSKNPTNPKKTKTTKPKKPTTKMPSILRCPSLLVNNNINHWCWRSAESIGNVRQPDQHNFTAGPYPRSRLSKKLNPESDPHIAKLQK